MKLNNNETKYMFFLMKDGELLNKFRKICDKVSNSTEKGYDCEPVYNAK